ncbi:MAG: hypothetical protein L0H23_01080 [Luteimonas sp.]|nr:hypothetical protein [Luteimonas sp.]
MSAGPGTCDHCGRDTTVIAHPYGTYCQPCRKSVLPRVACHGCGVTLRCPETVKSPLCARCVLAATFDGKPCVRCGRIPEKRRRRLLDDDRVACAACVRFLQPPTQCSICGELRQNCCRDFVLGIVEPACSKCRKRHSRLPNCAGCHRPRYPAGERGDKVYCALCLKMGKPPIIRCSVCREKRYAYASDTCEDCSWERSHQRLIAKFAPDFKTTWARELFAGYHREAHVASKRGNWRRSLKRDVQFFLALEQHFACAEDLSAVLMVRRMGPEAVLPYRRALSYLAHAGYVVLEADPDYVVEKFAIRARKLAARSSPWIQTVLNDFLDSLLHRRDRLTDRRRRSNVPTRPESLIACVRSAKKLLDFAEEASQVQELRQLDQNTLDLFLGAHKSFRLGVTSFIRYANTQGHLFTKLKLPKSSQIDVPAHLFLPEPVRLAKIEMLAAIREPRETRWALIALFNLVYAQMAHQSCQMRLDQVQETETGYAVRFARQWLELDELIVPLMRQWLSQRREISAFEEGTNPYLFPGQQSGTHVRPWCGHAFRKRYGVGGREGRATALATLVRSGMNQARMLSDCFGISLLRAHKYCTALGARDRAQSKFAHDRYGQ